MTEAVKETAEKSTAAVEETAAAEEPEKKKPARTRTRKTDSAAAEKAVKTAKETAEKAVKSVEEKAKKAEKTIKEAAEKTAVKKSAPKKAEPDTMLYVQYWGKQVDVKDVVEDIKAVWTDEMGKKLEDIKELRVYLKPEDNGAHFVINGEITGFVAM